MSVMYIRDKDGKLVPVKTIQGEPGKDYVLTDADKAEIAGMVDGGISVTGAKVGQTVKISEVDENGVPTAWEAVEFPSGGGGGSSDDGELFAVVADGGEQFIGFTNEELGISSLIDVKAIQVQGYNLQYLHESATGASYVQLKIKAETSAGYGHLFLGQQVVRAASKFEEGSKPGRNAFYSGKAEFIRRVTPEEYTAEPHLRAVSYVVGQNTKESARTKSELVIPARNEGAWYGTGTGVWLGPMEGYTWANGATFLVKIWRW